ncbi:MAG: hypothetical protein KTR25_17280 [Myxococcales bacterium]|nr:hypothetical protein [Myxococcales bacterium]
MSTFRGMDLLETAIFVMVGLLILICLGIFIRRLAFFPFLKKLHSSATASDHSWRSQQKTTSTNNRPPRSHNATALSSYQDNMQQPQSDDTIRSEIIYTQYQLGSARVVALLRIGDGIHNIHLLELDIVGEDLRPEVIEETVAGVACGDFNHSKIHPVDKVGYAVGWGITLPCPPQTH